MMTLITRLSEVAEVSQGLALSGRGAGAQAGEWRLRMVESRDVSDDRLRLDGLREVGVVRSVRTERHLLRPFDVLVTARAERPEAALVPTRVSRTVAGITLLVVRPRHPESGMGQFLWFYLTSADGRAQLARKTRPGVTFTFLSARDLGEMVIPTPPPRILDRVARLVGSSERAYAAATEAARLRRTTLRDALVRRICHTALPD